MTSAALLLTCRYMTPARGRSLDYKTPTTPEDPSIGLMTGIKEAAERHGFTLPDVGFLLHGTTIATNAILERKLPKAALVTTAGFEDVLEIGRHVRREVYALNPQQPPTLIPRDCRIGIMERIRPDGRIRGAADISGAGKPRRGARQDRSGQRGRLPDEFLPQPAA